MKIAKGYLKFNLEKDIFIWTTKRRKKYTLEQQQKQCDKAYRELKRQEVKGLITNLTYTDDHGKVTIRWERVS